MAYSESPFSFSSMSSFYRRRPNYDVYDVFLSTGAGGTRTNFSDRLYTALCQAGIRTFKYDDEIRREEIHPEILRAMEGSRISVVVFSRSYASSRWCLDQLVKIIECRQKTQQVVLPIFYDTDPSDVRNQTGSYAKAFDKEEMEKVNKWREALAQAANLPGWVLKNETNESRAELIKTIVNDVASKLGKKTLHVAKHPGQEEFGQANDLTGGGIELPTDTSDDQDELKKLGWTLLMTSIILEIASAVFDQLGNALVGMVLAFVALLHSTAELLIHMVRKERMRPSTSTVSDTIVEYFGLVGAVWQCVYSTVEYAYARQKKDNPIKMCLLPFIFLSCMAISKLVKKE